MIVFISQAFNMLFLAKFIYLDLKSILGHHEWQVHETLILQGPLKLRNFLYRSATITISNTLV